ncbi:MAG: SBBP repeat-containing protein [Chitinophagales bacterium]|nr:SBBP repeat-containing protein [Chitinophagales bacterium]
MKNFFTLISFLYFIDLSAQDFAWAKAFLGDSNQMISPSDIAIDSNGDVYTVGIFQGNVDFDPGIAPGEEYYINSFGGDDGFISKLSADGDFLWALSFGTTMHSESVTAVDVDNEGNVYLTGTFIGAQDFDPSPAEHILIANSSKYTNAADIFVLKLNSSGDFLWVKQFSGEENDLSGFLDVGELGNVVISGTFRGTMDFDPGSGQAIYTSSTSNNLDVYLVKLDSDGNYLWAKTIGSEHYDFAGDVFIDTNGDVYLTGGNSDSAYVTGGAILSSSGLLDIYILKFSPSGVLEYSQTIGGTGGDYGSRIIVDEYGEIYVAGIFSWTVDFDPSSTGTYNLSANGYFDYSSSNVFILKLNAAGDFAWVKGFGNNSQREYAWGLDLDSNRDIYLTGSFQQTVDFNSGQAPVILTSDSISTDVYVLKLKNNGDHEWIHRIGATRNDSGNALALDASNNIYVAGFFSNTVNFDPNGVFNLSANRPLAGFLFKWNQNLSTGIKKERFESELSYFPNPSSGDINIQMNESYPNLSLGVYDIAGQKIEEYSFENQSELKLSLTGPSALYLLHLKNSQGEEACLKVFKK